MYKVVFGMVTTFNISTHPLLTELEMVTFIRADLSRPPPVRSTELVLNYGLFFCHTHTHTDEAREGRNAYGDRFVRVCVLAVVTGLVLRRACKGEVAPSQASSSPSRR